MSKLTGKHKCSHCHSEFNWEYQTQTSPTNKNIIYAYRINDHSSDDIELSIECPNCQRMCFVYYTQSDARV